jgi:hypothetical protein
MPEQTDTGNLQQAAGAAAPTRKLVVVKGGSRRGTIRTDFGNLYCGGASCRGDFPVGAKVTLTGEAFAGGAFTGWSGPCEGAGNCVADMTNDFTVTATYSGGPNIAFVSSTTMNADFGSVANADARCQQLAQNAELPGRYIAWLYDSNGVNPIGRLAGSRGWVRPDGAVVADAVEDLSVKGPRHPLRLNEWGADIVGARFDIEALIIAWTGATERAGGRTARGTGVSSRDRTCNDWTTTDLTVRAGVGCGSCTLDSFSTLSLSDCGYKAHLYCFGVGNQAEATQRPVQGRLAFILGQRWVAMGGLRGADGACNREAELYGRGGSFRALLATTTSSAASRFNPNGPRWVRADGTPLTARGDSLHTSSVPFEVPPNVMVQGSSTNRVYWLGATSLREPGQPGQTCSDWTSFSNSLRGLVTQSSQSTAPYLAFGNMVVPCDAAEIERGILCFEE